MLSKTDWALSEISVKDRPRPAKRKASAKQLKVKEPCKGDRT